MQPNITEVKSALPLITNLKEKLSSKLSTTPDLLIRANNVLDTLFNGISFAINEPVDTNSKEAFTPTPIKSMFGKNITDSKSIKVEMKAIEPKVEDVNKFKEDVQKAYTTFLQRQSKELKESLTDLELRGVAKTAGLEVTPTTPETITLNFIDEIKEAIKSKTVLDGSIELTKAKQTLVDLESKYESLKTEHIGKEDAGTKKIFEEAEFEIELLKEKIAELEKK